MENMKFFVKRTNGRGRGILIVGPPGTGKTMFAKSLAKEFGVPLLIADIGSIFHGIVGSSEANMRRMIATAEAFGRSLLLVDEIEKAFSGLTGGGSTDGGTTQRTLSKFLTWLSDRRSLDTYVIATCNAVRLPPEYVRSGRFSTIFYLGLPGKKVRKEAWEIHKGHFQIPEEDTPPDDKDWTGAEIFQCCELAHDMQVSLKEAAGYVTHVTRIAKTDLEDLKKFALDTGLVPADDEEEEETTHIPEVA
jgi:SpoVK/Ycf46/Vps4 family AAA+-type ATPase